jgi:hypothetical protein
MDELYRQTGRYPMIYTSRYMWQQVLGAPTSFGAYHLWVACWKCDTLYLPKGWSDWDFWQVGQFKFKGIGGLDGNVFRSKDIAVLRSLKPKPVVVEGGDTYALDADSHVDLRGVRGTEVRIGIGDDPWGAWQPYGRSFAFTLGPTEGPQDVRVQLRSFRNVRSPVFRDGVVLDSVPPSIDTLTVSLVQGQRVRRDGSRVPAAARMAATDRTSGLDSSRLSASCGGEQRASAIGVTGLADLTVDLDLHDCDLVARARDVAGHRSERQLADLLVELVDARTSSERVALSGAWRQRRLEDALKRTILRSSVAGARARLKFTGSQVAIVAQRGPRGGLAQVRIDDEPVATIDLYAPDDDLRRIVFVANVRKGDHVIAVRVLGRGRDASAGTQVSLDAFLVLDRRR